jgi:hypothetical protein
VCTVSVLRLPGDVLRIACNRDEQVTRAAALPPVVRRLGGGMRTVMPVDPDSDGTWVAANERGVVMALLNYNPPGSRFAAAGLSRGEIIPLLISCETGRDAVKTIHTLEPERYGPFRLLVIDELTLTEISSDMRRFWFRSYPPAEPAILLTSSGLGDHVVERPRRELFEQMLAGLGAHARTQELFHGHQWGDRPHLSVRMRRADARTVSTTTIEVRPDEVSMAYRADDPEGRGSAEIIVLRSRGVTCS